MEAGFSDDEGSKSAAEESAAGESVAGESAAAEKDSLLMMPTSIDGQSEDGQSLEDEEIDPADYGKEEMWGEVFWNNVHSEAVDICLFEERLLTSNMRGNDAGEYKATAARVRRQGEDHIRITVENRAVDGRDRMGNSLECYLDAKTLNLIEQKHTHWVKTPDHHDMRKEVNMTQNEDGVVTVKRETTEGGMLKRARWRHKTTNSRSRIITEGHNVLLQRLMMHFDLRNEVAYRKIDSDTGELCRVLYKPLPMRKQTIDGVEVHVSGLERCVASPRGVPSMWQSYFLSDGQMTLMVQVGSSLVTQVERVPELIIKEVPDPKPKFGKKPLVWSEDMEMVSQYLDRKAALEADHESYLRHHPEVRDLVSDFFQYMLINRPDDVVGAAAKYFSSFSRHVDTDTDKERPELITKVCPFAHT